MKRAGFVGLGMIVAGIASFTGFAAWGQSGQNSAPRSPSTPQVNSPRAPELVEILEPDTPANRALLHGVRTNNPDKVRQAFEQGADPNTRLRSYIKSDPPSTRRPDPPAPLLSMVIASNSPDWANSEKLGRLANQKAIVIFTEFLNRGVEVKPGVGSDVHGDALFWLMTLDDVDLGLVAKVLDKGGDPNAVSQRSMGMNAVGWAQNRILFHREAEGIPLVRLILTRGGNPNVYDENGMTALHRACVAGFPLSVALLLKHGADPTLKTRGTKAIGRNMPEGLTPLMLARRSGNETIIKLLAEAKAKTGLSPEEAASAGDVATLQTYLEKGGDPNGKDVQNNPLLLIPLGLLPVIAGVIVLAQLQAFDYLDGLDRWMRDSTRLPLDAPIVYVPLGATLILLGLVIILAAFIGMNRSIVGAVAPESLQALPDVLHRRLALSQGARIVVIGGGTGLSTLLRGLKKYSSNLTAVVTMTDDGGSSGQLQKQMVGGILPPGDVRNCLVALADAEPVMQELFQYRFNTRSDDGLSGHSFGNLLIAAMTDITGDFEKAVEETANILNIRGRVLPTSVETVVLVGEMRDGREVTGETAIAKDSIAVHRIKLCPDNPKPLPEVVQAIRQADIIIMGPGSVYTSVIPNLLVREVSQAVASAKALRVYVCNVMTQPGETDGFSASRHVQAIEDHVRPYLSPKQRPFDYVLVNTTRPSDDLLARYQKIGAEFVSPDVDTISACGYLPVKGSFISESAVVRHDPDKIAKAILRLFAER